MDDCMYTYMLYMHAFARVLKDLCVHKHLHVHLITACVLHMHNCMYMYMYIWIVLLRICTCTQGVIWGGGNLSPLQNGSDLSIGVSVCGVECHWSSSSPPSRNSYIDKPWYMYT